MQTLEQARAEFQADLLAGTTCPCCDRSAKRYRRNISKTMVLFLVRLVRAAAEHGEEVHFSKLGVHARDYPWLADWGLADCVGGGKWKVTDAGRDFVAGHTSVPKFRWFYDAKSNRDPKSPRVTALEVMGSSSELADVIRHPKVVDYFARFAARAQGRLF